MPRWIMYAALILVGGATHPFAPQTVAPNDNRRPVGTLEKGVLTVALEARLGRWYPEGEGGRTLDVAAFAEEGKPLSTPGPLVRVAVGTTVRATVHNRLDKPLTVFGFGNTRGFSDSVVVPVDGKRAMSFTPTAPGTYYYVARREPDPLGGRTVEDAQLVGVIIVDPPNVKPNPSDRIMAMTFGCRVDPSSRTGLDRCTMAINGRSWPHTEHLTYTQGDSIRWRVINFTELDHPMHLHGFFFRVDSKGDGVVDSVYAPAQRRMGVTEVMAPFQTMSLAWKADRSGNWIYHCHYAAHLSDLVALDTDKGSLDSSMLAHHSSDRPHQMYGLVMGISVAPKGPAAAVTGPERRIRIVQREKPNVYGSQPGMSFVVTTSMRVQPFSQSQRGTDTPIVPGRCQEPPPPALRRCIFGAPPTTSDPCAFSLLGPSLGTPRSLDFLRSSASRIFAVRSSFECVNGFGSAGPETVARLLGSMSDPDRFDGFLDLAMVYLTCATSARSWRHFAR